MSDRIRELEAEVERLRRERDEVARSLRDRDALLRLAFEEAPTGMGVVSGLDARFKYVNRAYCEFLGRPAEYFLEGDSYQIWHEVSHPEDLLRERDSFQRVADGELKSYALEKRFLRPDGSVRWGLLSMTVSHDAAGRLEYLVGHIVDVHEAKLAAEQKRELEQQLLQSQRLEALGRLAGGLAHDFNNRLVVVMGYAELLRHALPATGALQEYTAQILNSAARSAELTRQLLGFTRRQVVAPCRLDLNATLCSMRSMLARLVGEQIELVTTTHATRSIFADPGQVEQVILNLTINARDAMPEGGRLVLEACDGLSDGDAAEADFVVLRVSDTGHGIAPELLPRVFEPFFTTKPPDRGTGLGLSTVHGIVQKSGGSVTVRSEPGLGTTFTVRWPVATTDGPSLRSQEVSAALSISPRLQALTVLVCDNDDAVRHLMRDVLSMIPCRVIEAADGATALSAIAHHQAEHPDQPLAACVVDAVMPRLSGLALARELRARFGEELPILFVSGHPEAGPSASLGLEREDFLAKPFLPGELVQRVRSLLDGRRGR